MYEMVEAAIEYVMAKVRHVIEVKAVRSSISFYGWQRHVCIPPHCRLWEILNNYYEIFPLVFDVFIGNFTGKFL